MGHRFSVAPNFTAAVGGMQAIAIDLQNGSMTAGADPRRTGYAVGW
jgi:gamma-glutamyltranspeptidase/glutathione hydrolase